MSDDIKTLKDLNKFLKILENIINKNKSHILIKHSEKTLKEINTKKGKLENQINEEIKKAEIEISLLRKNAHKKINKIAIETTAELLKKLIGAEVNNSSISAIVED